MGNVVRAQRGYFRVIGNAGFSDGLNMRDLQEAHADVDVVRLNELVQKKLVNIDSWRFRAEVIATAARVFQNFDLWLTLNASSNEYIYDLNWKLVEDTVQFIRTGERNVSLLTMKELILEHPDARRGVATPRRLAALNLKPNEFEHAVAMWCSRKDGFIDMLKTMNLFFGTSVNS